MERSPEGGIPWHPVNIIINILYENRQEQALDDLSRTYKGTPQLPEGTGGRHRVFKLHRGLYYPLDGLNVKPFAEIERDALCLQHDEGVPYSIFVTGPDDMPENPLGATYVAMCIETLEGFVGAGLAFELGSHIISVLENHPPDTIIKPMFLRFRRMEAYNELYLNLCELIAVESGGAFDRQAKLGKILKFWTMAEDNSEVSRLLKLYDENGPCRPGETQADYDAEKAEFQRLAQEGCLAAEVGLIFA